MGETPDRVVERVCRQAGISRAQFLAHDRSERMLYLRRIVAGLLREAGYSYPDIGRAIGRNHTTAMRLARALKPGDLDKFEGVGIIEIPDADEPQDEDRAQWDDTIRRLGAAAFPNERARIWRQAVRTIFPHSAERQLAQGMPRVIEVASGR